MGLIKCNACGKEVSEQATSCPSCGHPMKAASPSPGSVPPQKKKGSCLKTVLIVLGVIVVIGVIANLGSNGDKAKKVDTKTTEKASAKDKQDSKKKDTNTEAPTEAQTEAKDLFQVGETAEYNDVQVSVLGYEESAGNDFSKPEEGKTFIFVNIEIANNSADELNMSSMISFESYCDDYKLDYSAGALMALDGRNQLDGSVSSGKKMNGYLGLEVPVDWKVIETQFTDNVWTSSKIKFEIKK